MHKSIYNFRKAAKKMFEDVELAVAQMRGKTIEECIDELEQMFPAVIFYDKNGNSTRDEDARSDYWLSKKIVEGHVVTKNHGLVYSSDFHFIYVDIFVE